MRRDNICLYLGPANRAALQALISNCTSPRKLVWRQRMVVAPSICDVRARRGRQAGGGQQRYLDEGVAGLKRDKKQPSRGAPLPQEIRLKVTVKTAQKTPANAIHWSRALMSEAMGISSSSIGRIWAEAGVKPPLTKGFNISNYPMLEEKVTDIIGLYLAPPGRAVVFCIVEKTLIKALDRTQPGLPLKKGRAGCEIGQGHRQLHAAPSRERTPEIPATDR